MNRYGMSVHRVHEGEEKCDLFGEKTNFRALTSALVNKCVTEGKWFSFCTTIDDSQVNIMSIKNNKGLSMGSFISEYYGESPYRTAIYKYLLHEFLCYYEAPTVIKDRNTNGFKESFNKYLITSNINVVALWLGITVEEAETQYGSRLSDVDEDDGDYLFQYVKLYETKDHVRKVTRPRKDLDLGLVGTRIIPLYALKMGVDVLYEKLKEDTYNITFCKDSGQRRVINTTFNVSKIREVYKDEGFISKAVESWYEGDFVNNPTLERGYIRVLEMGGSIYDNPLRSINYARILKFEKAKPDLTYINIDLDSVLSTYKDAIYTIQTLDISEFVESLDIFDVGTSRKINGIPLSSRQDLDTWAETQVTLLSTVFLRQLALFMIGNPQWFEGYTGEPKVSSSAVIEDLDEDFELEFSM